MNLRWWKRSPSEGARSEVLKYLAQVEVEFEAMTSVETRLELAGDVDFMSAVMVFCETACLRNKPPEWAAGVLDDAAMVYEQDGVAAALRALQREGDKIR